MRAFKRVIRMQIDLFMMIARLHEMWANEDDNLVMNTPKCYPLVPVGY